MNYGRFFRLNQSLSKIDGGIAIYDYIDLPAYFGPSEENPMSPKYPISVTITADSICFRLHYSAFKLEKYDDFEQREHNIKKTINNAERKNLSSQDFPRYAYDKDDIDIKALPKIENIGFTSASMAHMEETILELPFTEVTSNKLSDTIKNIYNTRFPMVDENTSMGGRYLELLLKKRYTIIDEDSSENSIEHNLYRKLHEVTDSAASYSTLWLMDLFKNGRINLYQEETDNKKDKEQNRPIVGFLRKLLLDFMFDLKHSDVFQNSANYQKMYSGLMSDFYFSALMHKCEYYYYRKLIRTAINQEGEYDRDAIVTLYAEELSRAEDFWVKDVMSPEAENLFYYDKKKHSICQELKEDSLFENYPSWFADPEEEMRRICFTMREKGSNQERHMCNMDILVRLLNIQHDEKENNQIESNMFKMRDATHENISRWFLKRYDFKDLFHLHMHKYANIFIISVLVVSIILLIPWPWGTVKLEYIPIVGSFLLFLLSVQRLVSTKIPNTTAKNRIDKRRNKMALSRIIGTCIFAGLTTIFFVICFLPEKENWIKAKDAILESNFCTLFVISGLITAPLIAATPWNKLKAKTFRIEPRLQHIMSNLHLLLPRLVASITASWITLSVGFDLYVAFFDSTPDWSTVIVLIFILLLFVMYEINKVTPHKNAKVKLFRSIELMIFSYTISLIVGLFIINFLGEKFLEKGGYVGEGDFYNQYVSTGNKRFHIINDDDTFKLGNKADEELFHNNVNALKHVYHGGIIDTVKVKNTNRKKINIYYSYALIENIPLFGVKHIFVLRDFLIMFSFIAMFMGIFIQLIIFGDNKQMTEL